MSTSKRKVISQHNHLTFARYDLTPIEKDIIYTIISMLKKDDEKDKVYTVELSELQRLRKKKMNHSELMKTCKLLITKSINIRHSEKHSRFINFFQEVEYNAGKVNIILTSGIRPLLFNLSKNFTKYSLMEALNLKSKYSKRIYEIISSWKSKGKYKVHIDKFRKMMFLEDKMKTTTNLKNRVLVPAMDEINTVKTSLYLEIQFEYFGKKVQYVVFLVRQKTEADYQKAKKIEEIDKKKKLEKQ